VATKEQLAFLQIFETSKPSNPLFCHQEFLEKLVQHGRDSIGRRTAFLMQRLSVDIRRLHYKVSGSPACSSWWQNGRRSSLKR
jgi:hypothetical protein